MDAGSGDSSKFMSWLDSVFKLQFEQVLPELELQAAGCGTKSGTYVVRDRTHDHGESVATTGSMIKWRDANGKRLWRIRQSRSDHRHPLPRRRVAHSKANGMPVFRMVDSAGAQLTGLLTSLWTSAS